MAAVDDFSSFIRRVTTHHEDSAFFSGSQRGWCFFFPPYHPSSDREFFVSPYDCSNLGLVQLLQAFGEGEPFFFTKSHRSGTKVSGYYLHFEHVHWNVQVHFPGDKSWEFCIPLTQDGTSQKNASMVDDGQEDKLVYEHAVMPSTDDGEATWAPNRLLKSWEIQLVMQFLYWEYF